jgi:hypothetical protein
MKFLEFTLYQTAKGQNRVFVHLDNVTSIRECVNEYSKEKYSLIITNRENIEVKESFDEINELLKTFY